MRILYLMEIGVEQIKICVLSITPLGEKVDFDGHVFPNCSNMQ